jgi:hypothetical protein
MRFIKFHGTRQDQIDRLREQGWRFATMTTAPVVVGWHQERGKVSAKAWQFKADKPAWHYLFSNEAAARDYVTRYTAGVKSNADYRTKRDADRRATRCDGVAAVYAKAAREGYITAAETAVCLRVALARAFPGVKFSVRSDNSITVRWTDGPTVKEVEKIAHSYSGEGFDGSIDLRHSIQRWLSSDGSMSLAHDSGTQGSMGHAPELIGSAHAPDAVLVSLGADFVFCERALSDGVKGDLLVWLCDFSEVWIARWFHKRRMRLASIRPENFRT